MSVSLYFGLPGAGKSTLLAAMAYKGLRKRSPYKNVYSNIPIAIEGVKNVTVDDLNNYSLHDGLLLFDEGSVFFNSREYKQTSRRILDFFMLHRHWNLDIVIFSQGWDTCDKRIRQITDRVFYLYKGLFTGHWFSRYYRVPYGIIIPDPDNGNEKLGEIVQGYCKPGLMQRLFGGWLFRPKYYKYFDSWERPSLPELPEDRTYHVARPTLAKGRSRAKKQIPENKELTG